MIHNRLKQRWHKQDGNARELHVWSSGFKALITWHALTTLQECREACGGQGYKAENRIGMLHASHNVSLTYEGDNHVLLQAVTKTVLGEFVRGASEGLFKGHFAYLNDRDALQNIADDVRDLDRFAMVAMRRREGAVFAKLAVKVRKAKNAGASTTQLFNQYGPLVEEAGRAHTELLMLDVLREEIAGMEKRGDRDMAAVVRTCGQLFALSRFHAQSVFLRVGALTTKQADRVDDEVSALCTELRPQALHVVNAFGLPPVALAPIAFDYESHNSHARL